MNPSHGPRVIFWSVLSALAVAAVLVAVFWKGGSDRANQSGAAAAKEAVGAGPVTAPGTAETKPADFSHLPPAERINAETKARMEQNAAWREKLHNGNYSTLPAEAYPAGVPPPQTPKSP